jgi:hypothetical protein
MCIFVESQFITHDVKPGFVTLVVYAALFRILFMAVDVLYYIHIGVNRSFLCTRVVTISSCSVSGAWRMHVCVLLCSL